VVYGDQYDVWPLIWAGERLAGPLQHLFSQRGVYPQSRVRESYHAARFDPELC